MSEQKRNDKIIDFQDRLSFSRGKRESSDIETIKSLIPGCISVVKTDVETDKKGIDYIATLRRGATILIDAKTRDHGCSKFWKDGPEFAPEIWSVMPGGKYKIPKEKAKAGWTLTEKSDVDYIYCTFDPFDCDEVFMLPFQLYRAAFLRNLHKWEKRYFKPKPQDSEFWESQCLFVPVDVVLSAINFEMRPFKGGKITGEHRNPIQKNEVKMEIKTLLTEEDLNFLYGHSTVATPINFAACLR